MATTVSEGISPAPIGDVRASRQTPKSSPGRSFMRQFSMTPFRAMSSSEDINAPAAYRQPVSALNGEPRTLSAASSSVSIASSAGSAGQHRRRYNDTRELDVLVSELNAEARMRGRASDRASGVETPRYSQAMQTSPTLDMGLISERLRSSGFRSPPHSPYMGSPRSASASQLNVARSLGGFPSSLSLLGTSGASVYEDPSDSALSLPTDTILVSPSESASRRFALPEGMVVGMQDSPYPSLSRARMDPSESFDGSGFNTLGDSASMYTVASSPTVAPREGTATPGTNAGRPPTLVMSMQEKGTATPSAVRRQRTLLRRSRPHAKNSIDLDRSQPAIVETPTPPADPMTLEPEADMAPAPGRHLAPTSQLSAPLAAEGKYAVPTHSSAAGTPAAVEDADRASAMSRQPTPDGKLPQVAAEGQAQPPQSARAPQGPAMSRSFPAPDMPKTTTGKTSRRANASTDPDLVPPKAPWLSSARSEGPSTPSSAKYVREFGRDTRQNGLGRDAPGNASTVSLFSLRGLSNVLGTSDEKRKSRWARIGNMFRWKGKNKKAAAEKTAALTNVNGAPPANVTQEGAPMLDVREGVFRADPPHAAPGKEATTGGLQNSIPMLAPPLVGATAVPAMAASFQPHPVQGGAEKLSDSATGPTEYHGLAPPIGMGMQATAAPTRVPWALRTAPSDVGAHAGAGSVEPEEMQRAGYSAFSDAPRLPDVDLSPLLHSAAQTPEPPAAPQPEVQSAPTNGLFFAPSRSGMRPDDPSDDAATTGALPAIVDAGGSYSPRSLADSRMSMYMDAADTAASSPTNRGNMPLYLWTATTTPTRSTAASGSPETAGPSSLPMARLTELMERDANGTSGVAQLA
ncbi:hypothetical protein MSPP1_002301 [Malassezia sp. CBS 17886]|nr:hypothetical protein MSPP1_002301 [Malassezia sp. CBS 17886]